MTSNSVVRWGCRWYSHWNWWCGCNPSYPTPI